MASINSFDWKRAFNVDGKEYNYFSIKAAEENGAGNLSNLPYSLKVLAENLLRNEDGISVTADDITSLGKWVSETKKNISKYGLNNFKISSAVANDEDKFLGLSGYIKRKIFNRKNRK